MIWPCVALFLATVSALPALSKENVAEIGSPALVQVDNPPLGAIPWIKTLLEQRFQNPDAVVEPSLATSESDLPTDEEANYLVQMNKQLHLTPSEKRLATSSTSMDTSSIGSSSSAYNRDWTTEYSFDNEQGQSTSLHSAVASVPTSSRVDDEEVLSQNSFFSPAWEGLSGSARTSLYLGQSSGGSSASTSSAASVILG
eukprot:c9119_g1_i2.p1 GENE.c9119_g1_i2~~c9119_g1_i2.p1  ORF type:complete len:206 (+),score=26.58 c9119_g1_i2:23-619(+)